MGETGLLGSGFGDVGGTRWVSMFEEDVEVELDVDMDAKLNMELYV